MLIWQSTPFMTFIDIVMLAGAAVLIRLLIRHREWMLEEGAIAGPVAATAGVGLIVLIFLADFIAMWMLPAVIGAPFAIEARRALHLQLSGPTLMVGLLFLFAGYATVHRRLVSILQEMRRAETDLVADNRRIRADNDRLERRVDVRTEALKLTREGFRHLVANLGHIFFSFTASRDFRVTEASDSVSRVLGYRPDEITGRIVDYLTADPGNVVLAGRLLSAMQGEWVPPTQCEVRAQDGSRRHLEIMLFPLEGSDGEICQLEAIAKDITAEKEADRALRRSNDELEQVVRERTLDLLHTNAELGASRDRLQRLATALHHVREEERAYVSRELHDQLGQCLTGIKLDLAWLGQREPDESGPSRERLEAAERLADEALASVRRLALELRPAMLDDFGLSAAVEWQASEFSRRTLVGVGLSLAVDTLEPDHERDTVLFRILQESLTNVARHADARRVWIHLRYAEQELELRIADDGRGLSPDEIRTSSLGLLGMKERAEAIGGSVRLESSEHGTTITARVPVVEMRTSTMGAA